VDAAGNHNRFSIHIGGPITRDLTNRGMGIFPEYHTILAWPIKQWPEIPVVLKVFSLVHIKILYQGPKTWNSLPVTITSLSSFPNLKKKLLEFLVK